MTDETEGLDEALADVVSSLDDVIGDLKELVEHDEVTVLVPAGRGFTLTVFGRSEPQVPLGELYDGF